MLMNEMVARCCRVIETSSTTSRITRVIRSALVTRYDPVSVINALGIIPDLLAFQEADLTLRDSAVANPALPAAFALLVGFLSLFEGLFFALAFRCGHSFEESLSVLLVHVVEHLDDGGVPLAAHIAHSLIQIAERGGHGDLL